MTDIDETFYDRADAHINLSNDQMADVSRGMVSASMMYSVARFNAYVSACGFDNREDMKTTRAATIEYFSGEYKRMLEENLDDYIENFDQYFNASGTDAGQ